MSEGCCRRIWSPTTPDLVNSPVFLTQMSSPPPSQMSLQQLVKELEAQLAQLKGFSRDQALQLADAQEEAEQWSARAGTLEQVGGNQG